MQNSMTEVPFARQGTGFALALGALGVVFGDIGTSPLYALQTVFSIDHNSVKPTPVDVFGVISMVIWSITIVVSVKYVALIMRADNDGEGGILALVALLRENEDTLDIEFPDGGVSFDLSKADVEVQPLDVVEGSHILKGILPWPWEAEPATDMESGQVGWEVLQSQNLHDGTHLAAGEWAILLSTEAHLNEAEARLIAKAPEMYALLRQLLAGQPVMTQVGHLINELELSMEKGKP